MIPSITPSAEHATRDRYAAAAKAPEAALCCPVDYDPQYLKIIPQEVIEKDYGCGDPSKYLRPGETVLDLGSGAGFDSFLAARQVGATGRVLGVDMTPAMLERARANAARLGLTQVEFREGKIEALPVEDATVDVILSNCVINLSPDKPAVFREALRVLKPGGRLAIADVVALRALPESFRQDAALIAGCIGGAATVDETTAMLRDAGFVDIVVQVKPESREVIATWAPGSGAEDMVASATIEARRPR